MSVTTQANQWTDHSSDEGLDGICGGLFGKIRETQCTLLALLGCALEQAV